MDLDHPLLDPRSTVSPSDVVNSRNHGAYVTVAAVLCLILSLLFVGARLTVRWPSKATLGREDPVMPVALALSVVQTILCLADVPVGLGRRADALGPSATAAVLKIVYASDLLFVISLALGRLAVGIFLARLSNQQRQRRIIVVVATACGIYGLTSFLLVAIRSPATVPANMLPRWIAVSVMGSFLDLCIVIAPIVLVWNLSMKRATRMAVVIGFAMRLPLIAISAVRVLSLSHFIGIQPDLPFHLAKPVAWGQFEMHYNLVSAIIPCLRLSLQVWDTHQLGNLTLFDGTLSGLRTTQPTISDPLSHREMVEAPPRDPPPAQNNKDGSGIEISRADPEAAAHAEEHAENVR